MSSKQRLKTARAEARDLFAARRRIKQLASQITTETELQRRLVTVDPPRRLAVEAMIRPHTKIPKETVQ